MTLLTVSNQGFTVHNHKCGINFLSHVRGAPQKCTPIWDEVGCSGMHGEGVGEIAKIANIGNRRN